MCYIYEYEADRMARKAGSGIMEIDSITNGFLKIYSRFLDLHIKANICLLLPSIPDTGVYIFLFWVQTVCEDEILMLSSSDCSSGKKITLLQYFHHPGCYSHCVTFQTSLGLLLCTVSCCASQPMYYCKEKKYVITGTHAKLPAFCDKVKWNFLKAHFNLNGC